MEPASKIIKALGGAAVVAQIAGVHRTRVYGWMRSKEDGGTGGLIPFPHIRKIIAAAQAQGVHLTGNDFIPADAGADHPPAHGDAPATAQGDAA